MAKTLKQLLADDKRKKVRVKKLEAELNKEKSTLSQIQKLIPAQRKKEAETGKKGGKKKKKAAPKK